MEISGSSQIKADDLTQASQQPNNGTVRSVTEDITSDPTQGGGPVSSITESATTSDPNQRSSQVGSATESATLDPDDIQEASGEEESTTQPTPLETDTSSPPLETGKGDRVDLFS